MTKYEQYVTEAQNFVEDQGANSLYPLVILAGSKTSIIHTNNGVYEVPSQPLFDLLKSWRFEFEGPGGAEDAELETTNSNKVEPVEESWKGDKDAN